MRRHLDEQRESSTEDELADDSKTRAARRVQDVRNQDESEALRCLRMFAAVRKAFVLRCQKQQLSNGVIEETQRDNCMDLLFECFATNQVRRRQNIVLCNQYLPLDLGFHCLSRVLECCGVRNSSSRSSCLA